MSEASNMNRGHASRRARASRVKGARVKPVAQPVVRVKPDPLVWAYALKVAEGDPRRIVVLTDGAVVVANRPVR